MFRRLPSSVNCGFAVRNLSCRGASTLPAHACTPLRCLRGSRAVGAVRGESGNRTFSAGRPESDASPGPGLLASRVGVDDHPGQDAQPSRGRFSLLGGAGERFPLCRPPASVPWSPRQLVHLSGVCRGSLDRGPRKRVCTNQTGDKTPQGSAQGCGALQVLCFLAPSMQYRGCTGV